MDEPILELDAALRKAYKFLRFQRRPILKGLALQLWERAHGPRPTTFMVAADGTCWRYDKAALLAELRLLIVRHFPVGLLVSFDR